MVKAIAQIAGFIVISFLKWAVGRKPSAREGGGKPELREALKSKLHNKLKIAVCAAFLCLVGCNATKTVYVPDGSPLRLREDIASAKVWVWVEDEKRWVVGELTIPEGWYCLELSEDEIDELGASTDNE